MTINVGLVGYGYAGATLHVPLIQAVEELNLTTILTSKKQIPELSNIATTTDFNNLLEANVDLIVITSPNTTHFEYAKSTIKAKKHVVVEKPFTITSQEAQELIDLAEENNVILTVFHNRRWDSEFLTLKNLLESNELGEISTYEAHFDRFRPIVQCRWKEEAKPGSGTLYDLGSHLIDQALHLFGTPQSIFADIRSERCNAQSDDYFHIILNYPTHKAILHSSSLVIEPEIKLSVHGSKGSFICKNFDQQEEQLKSGIYPNNKNYGISDTADMMLTTIKDSTPIKTRIAPIKGNYPSFYKELASSITNTTPPPINPKDAMLTIKTIELAIKSNNEKRRLPILPG